MGSGNSKWVDYGSLLIKVKPIYLKHKWILQIVFKLYISFDTLIKVEI